MKTLKKPEILLASASPRRYELLSQLGFQVLVKPVDIDESRYSDESPAIYCQRLAIEKNQVAVKRFGQLQPMAIVTADTIVVVGDKTLGKPKNTEQVISTLKQLSATDEALDKAGGYGIQGAAGRWIISIKGSYSGIMGLPLYETSQLLTKLDIMTVTDV